MVRVPRPHTPTDPLAAARVVIGWVWPGLLCFLFTAAQIGSGPPGTLFWVRNPAALRAAFAVTALAALLTAVVRRPHVIIVAAGVIALTCLGRSWAVVAMWVDTRDHGLDPPTSLLVGAGLWVAVALSHVMFAGALLAIAAGDRRARTGTLT